MSHLHLHPTEKEERRVIDQVAMATSPFPYLGVVKDESHPLHPTEEEKSMVMDCHGQVPLFLIQEW